MIEAIISIVAVAVAAFWFGGRQVKERQHKEQRERNAKAHERAREVKNEVGGLDGNAVRDRLRDRAGR